MTVQPTHFRATWQPASAAPPRRARVAAPLYRRGGKRALDIVLILLSLPVVLPVIALAALAVFLSDGGAPFFRQARIGRGGRLFTCWKLRTMVPGAQALLEAHLAANPAARREWDETQKLKHDPRITLVGAVLRKTSLDELPQLWNVLKGEMSLVGPRPIMIDQIALYPGTAYYGLRPGITGPWQVSDRNQCSFAARAEFDEEYDRSLSLGRDAGLILATVGVVLRGTGY